MEVIETLAKTKTVLLITHRLANVVHADQIYVMEAGAIVERGSFAQLVNGDGGFATAVECTAGTGELWKGAGT